MASYLVSYSPRTRDSTNSYYFLYRVLTFFLIFDLYYIFELFFGDWRSLKVNGFCHSIPQQDLLRYNWNDFSANYFFQLLFSNGSSYCFWQYYILQQLYRCSIIHNLDCWHVVIFFQQWPFGGHRGIYHYRNYTLINPYKFIEWDPPLGKV